MAIETNYRISDDFKNLLPPLADEEYQSLKDEIVKSKKVRDSIILWVNPEDKGIPILVDGHNRHQIHTELKYLPPLKIEGMEFDSKYDAMKWIITHQGARRNLSAEKRAYIVLFNKPLCAMIEKSAMERMEGVASNDARGKTSAHLAIFAGVSATTIERAKKAIKIIDNSNDQEIQKRVYAPSSEQDRLGLQDAVKELKNKAKIQHSKAFQLPQLDESNKGKLDIIHNADVNDGLNLIDDNSVHLIISSPPYANEFIKYENMESNYKGYDNWLEILHQAYSTMFLKQVSGGRNFIQIDSCNGQGIDDEKDGIQPVYYDVIKMMKDIGYKFRWEYVWYKQSSVGSRPNWGSFGSPANPRVRRQHEYILGFYKDSQNLPGDKNNIDITDDEFKRFTLSHWYIHAMPRKNPDQNGFHPAPFPSLIPYALIKLYSYMGNVVLDPFNGSGTTTCIAKTLNRRFIGIDNSPSYCKYAQDRIDSLNGMSNEIMRESLSITDEMIMRINKAE